MSSANSLGCSKAAKCPPAFISVTLISFSNLRIKSVFNANIIGISFGKTAQAAGTLTLALYVYIIRNENFGNLVNNIYNSHVQHAYCTLYSDVYTYIKWGRARYLLLAYSEYRRIDVVIEPVTQYTMTLSNSSSVLNLDRPPSGRFL